jgi:tetratricopeptide (TPR) repeat protein
MIPWLTPSNPMAKLLILGLLAALLPIAVNTIRIRHAQELYEQASDALSRRDYAQAAQKWLAWSNELPKHNTESVGRLLDSAGSLLNSNDIQDAERLELQAIKIAKKELGKEHPETAMAIFSLAKMYEWNGRYSDADLLFREGIQNRDLIQHKNMADASALDNEADLCVWSKRFAEAERYYRKALCIRHEIQSNDSNGQLMAKLASVCLLERKYADVEELCKKILGLSEKPSIQRLAACDKANTLTNNMDIASAMNNLASVYVVQKHYSEAETLYNASLRMCEREGVLGQDFGSYAGIIFFHIPTSVSIQHELTHLSTLRQRYGS